MKTVVALCLLAVFCTVHANPLDILRQGVERARNDVRDTINKLDRLRSNTVQKTVSESVHSLSNQKMLLIKFSDTMIKAIKNQTEAAKAKSKNAQTCYDNALNLFNGIKATAMQNGDQCVETAKTSIKNQLAFIDDLISVGQQHVARLDSIFPNCFSGNIFQMQQCVALQLGQANQLVKNWFAGANRAEWTAASASRDISRQSNICIASVFKPTNDQITDATYAAYECIKNL